ncbi:unnamed protein product [Peronospora destructor]|uniref:Nudix hydrolase domain-containing protein n=1 Tax=Peronospora destructor TaxID=86335 RepID=A0AAV0T274_9STRA|nr:unnamed protein product [Peronospora destructor]
MSSQYQAVVAVGLYRRRGQQCNWQGRPCCHAHVSPPHRASYIVIKNSSGKYYVQRRTIMKDYCPGMLDPVTGGGVQYGEPMDVNAAREAKEEMGVNNTPLCYLTTFYYGDDHSRVWSGLFDCTFDGPLVLQEDEVDKVLTMTANEILARRREFTPDGMFAFEKYLELIESATGGNKLYTPCKAFLPPSSSVLLFGGADGNIFFEDSYLLNLTQYGRPYDQSGCVMTCRRAAEVEMKLMTYSGRDSWYHGTRRLLPCSSLFLSATCNDTNSRATESEVERRPSTLLHSGGGRDYHTMHYVLSSADDEKTQGMRVLVIGNVVVASEEGAAQCGRGTQAQGSAANAAMAFHILTLRVEELRVRQSLLKAQWKVRCVDVASM